jgi:hypothetical protein
MRKKASNKMTKTGRVKIIKKTGIIYQNSGTIYQNGRKREATNPKTTLFFLFS